MTSETSPGSTLARFKTSAIAALPSSWAGSLDKTPPKAPTAVRAAEVMTTSCPFWAMALNSSGGWVVKTAYN